MPKFWDKQILFLADIGIEKVCERSDLIEKTSGTGAIRVFQRRECERDFSAILSTFPYPEPCGRSSKRGTIAMMNGSLSQEVANVLRDKQSHGIPCGFIHQIIEGG